MHDYMTYVKNVLLKILNNFIKIKDEPFFYELLF